MTNDELIAKFRSNAQGVISTRNADGIVDAVFAIESLHDVGALMALTAPDATPRVRLAAWK